MITLAQRLKKQQVESTKTHSRISVRDKLLVKESQELAQLLPPNCSVEYENENDLSEFTLILKPTEGYWENGIFRFNIYITEEYNMVPPKVRCLTKLWHPNISENGEICLSLLRQHSVDGLGWSPTRRLKDVVWGLYALFTDLLNFEDPLNIEAADMYKHSKLDFQSKVEQYVKLYAKN
ncbi:NEDD8-conjugating enzyme UBE2F-like [Coccinella septempunctata]|uniref:NEDD8-conjugating enzyme UBE2F-like n=1 Tax=Coccinella septempunctata TaxID=41139 RepID=UPI001D099D65|nr:NEDD8-conjugating enzyme UBE2F-like [Coccinella septempunctata]